MLVVNVKTNIDAALAKLNATAEEARKAVPRALNKTAATARAQAAREIQKAGYQLKVGAIKKAITIRRANRSELTAILRAKGKPIPLIKYGARQTKAGVTVAVLNGRKLIKSAFIATMPKGHKGVYLRVGTAEERNAIKAGRMKISKGRTKAVYKHGLPIRELFGPAIPQAFANQIVQEALVQAIEQRFPTVLAQELNFVRLK